MTLVEKVGLDQGQGRHSEPRRAGLKSEVEVLVDTGASLSWFPRPVLEGLKIKPRRRRVFVTIDSRRLTREVGLALISYGGGGRGSGRLRRAG